MVRTVNSTSEPSIRPLGSSTFARERAVRTSSGVRLYAASFCGSIHIRMA